MLTVSLILNPNPPFAIPQQTTGNQPLNRQVRDQLGKQICDAAGVGNVPNPSLVVIAVIYVAHADNF